MNDSEGRPEGVGWLIGPMAPPELVALTTSSQLLPLLIAFMAWIAREVSLTLDLPSKGLLLDVSWVEYYCKYPGLTVKRTDKNAVLPDDLDDTIHYVFLKLLQERSVMEFLCYCASHREHLTKLQIVPTW